MFCSDLTVYLTTKEQRSPGKMCRPYKYLITTAGGASLHAFVNPLAFKHWLRMRGLRLVKTGKRCAKIIGEYKTVLLDHEPKDCNTVVLSNGDYVPATAKDGVIYYQKPTGRRKFSHDEYVKAEKIYG